MAINNSNALGRERAQCRHATTWTTKAANGAHPKTKYLENQGKLKRLKPLLREGDRKGGDSHFRSSSSCSSSLIPETLKELEHRGSQRVDDVIVNSQELKRTASMAKAMEHWAGKDENAFEKKLKKEFSGDIVRNAAHTLIINVGLYCNQACSHCHVDSSPLRKDEVMTNETADRILEVLERTIEASHQRDGIGAEAYTVDLTGGAPELCPAFRRLVLGAKKLNIGRIIDRCNLTVLMEPGQEDLADFLVEHNVQVVASLPCYSKDNVNKQRGFGVFERSIAGLQLLNEKGYGVKESGLKLDLIYNPGGAFLPPNQAKLEDAYKAELLDSFGIQFSNLVTLANLPIKRFLDYLIRQNELDSYMQLLIDNFNPNTVDKLMCRDSISIDWQGYVYDCDFNQQLMMGIFSNNVAEGYLRKSRSLNVNDIDDFQTLVGRKVLTGSHCFGCTAGAGSS